MRDTWEVVDEEEEIRKPVRRGDRWERADDRKRETTESARYSFRERLNLVFGDWTKEDWDSIRTLTQMQKILDVRNTFAPTTKRDEYGRLQHQNATWNQSRLAWEIIKGRTYAKLESGYTYSFHRFGIRAESRIVYNNKTYRKGQFLPKKYMTDK